MTSPNITYRKATSYDRDFLLQLYATTRTDVQQHGGHLSQAERDAFIEMQFNFQDIHYKKEFLKAEFLIIMLKGRDIGRLYVDEREAAFHIIDITLDPDFRSAGIGAKIMKNLIEKAQKKKKSVSIYVAKKNRAIRFYDRLGFVIEKSEETPIYHFMAKPSCIEALVD